MTQVKKQVSLHFYCFSSYKKTGKGKQLKKRKYRDRPGQLALKEIRRLEKSFDLLILTTRMQRLIREISKGLVRVDLKFQSASLGALHETAEAYLVDLFEDTNLCVIHASRHLLGQKDLERTA